MTWVEAGLAAAVGLPVAVIVTMIFWPSEYDDPSDTDADSQPTDRLP